MPPFDSYDYWANNMMDFLYHLVQLGAGIYGIWVGILLLKLAFKRARG